MFYLLFLSLLIFFISLIIMMLATLCAKKSLNDREKNSPFECGFDPMNTSRLPFSIRFFLISIIFLIFDVEIALILPVTLIFKISNIMNWSISIIIFIIILLLGIYHEWNQGALDWTN